MAAAGTSPALNLREKLAELAGLKQRVSPDLVRVDFGNLVTNGTFDTDTDWTKETGWTIGSGVATGVAGTATFLKNPYPIGVVPSASYLFTGTLTGVAGGIIPHLGGTVGTTYTGDGTFSDLMRFGTDSTYGAAIWKGSTGAATVDNVSLYEADPSDDAPWLRLPYGYKVGTRGMIVRDGVVLHPSDYTEITDSGQTFIKPIVAPGVSTEFSIWAGA